jgi:hypothetical protein
MSSVLPLCPDVRAQSENPTALIPAISALVLPVSVRQLEDQSGSGWRLASYVELRALAACGGLGTQPPEGLYWVSAPDARGQHYAWYLHWPTLQMLDYGDLVLPARLVLVQPLLPPSRPQKPQ